MSNKYEIEIKTLLGSEEKAEELRNKLREKNGELEAIGQGSQLNHYFNTPTDLEKFSNHLKSFIPEDHQESFDKIITEGKNISIRTRDANGTVSFVIKASIDDHSSSNGVSRMEFEVPIADKTLDELDQVVLGAGLTYQAKWSRQREEYRSGDINITIDKNAGYGYLAEFERVIEDIAEAPRVKDELLAFMDELGVKELPQDRLERMFSHYNLSWPEYYGTDKIFNIE